MLKYVSFLLSSFNIHVRMTLIHSVSFPQVGSLGVDYTCLLSDVLKINMKQQQQFLANILPPGPWCRLHLVRQTHGEGETSGRQSVLVSMTTSIHVVYTATKCDWCLELGKKKRMLPCFSSQVELSIGNKTGSTSTKTGSEREKTYWRRQRGKPNTLKKKKDSETVASNGQPPLKKKQFRREPKTVSEVGFEPTPTYVDQNPLGLWKATETSRATRMYSYVQKELNLESGALDRSAILTTGFEWSKVL